LSKGFGDIDVPIPMMNSPTIKVACTPKEKISGVAGILIAALSPSGSG
jgi:hypothetical protein